MAISITGYSNDIARDSVSKLEYNSFAIQSDTLLTSFKNDTITLKKPISVSQIIYAEHKESPSVLYNLILPIIMLVFGVIIDRLAQIFVDKGRMKKNGRRWKYELLSCVKPIQKQIEALSEFQNSYCKDSLRYDIPDIPIYPYLSGKDFLSLNKEDLYDYLMYKMGGKKKIEKQAQDRFYKITTFVMSLEMIHDSIMESFKSFKDESSNQIESFNNTQVGYSQILLSKYREQNDELYHGLMNIFNKAFEKQPDVNLLTLEEKLISPSLSLLCNPKSVENSSLIDKLIDMRFYINGIKNEKTYLQDGIENVIEQYKLCLKALNEILDYFKI